MTQILTDPVSWCLTATTGSWIVISKHSYIGNLVLEYVLVKIELLKIYWPLVIIHFHCKRTRNNLHILWQAVCLPGYPLYIYSELKLGCHLLHLDIDSQFGNGKSFETSSRFKTILFCPLKAFSDSLVEKIGSNKKICSKNSLHKIWCLAKMQAFFMP